MNKIGIAVITHNRENQIKTVLEAIKDCADVYCVVNDGTPYSNEVYPKHFTVLQHDKPLSVGIAKNTGMKYLMDNDCDYIFTIEDDMLIKDTKIFNKYIDASKVSGIKHFNFGFHGSANMKNGKPNPRITVEYSDDLKVVLNQHCVGALSFFDREVIEKCGYHDEKLNHNSYEHVELAFRIIKAGYHSPFWFFADLLDSPDYISELSTVKQSVIRKSDEWTRNMNEGRKYFHEKHGIDVLHISDTSEQYVYKWLERKEIEVKGGQMDGLYLKEKVDLKDVTFMIPFNIDSQDRIDNLKRIIKYLNQNYITNILVAEQNTECNELKQMVNEGLCQRISAKTGDEKLNYKTHLMNQLIKHSNTEIVIQYDVDVITYPKQLLEAVELIKTKKEVFVLPYDGTFFNVPKNEFDNFLKDSINHSKMALFSTSSYGGIFVMDKNTITSLGGFNENLISWGFEDDEIRIRIIKMGYKINRTNGKIYHLDHVRNSNSSSNHKHYKTNQELVVALSKMTKEELQNEISKWTWL